MFLRILHWNAVHGCKEVFFRSVSGSGHYQLPVHDLRHTFGTRLADAGVDVVKIKELTITHGRDDDALLHKFVTTENGRSFNLP